MTDTATEPMTYAHEAAAEEASLLRAFGSKPPLEIRIAIGVAASATVAVRRTRARLDQIEARHRDQLSELAAQVRALTDRLAQAETKASAPAPTGTVKRPRASRKG